MGPRDSGGGLAPRLARLAARGRHAAALIAELPEIGRLDRRRIRARVGVAPSANDSGSSRGRGRITGGRFQVRRALQVATLPAIRRNAPIRSFHERRAAAGTLEKVAPIACVRTLVTHLDAIARDHLNAHDRLPIA